MDMAHNHPNPQFRRNNWLLLDGEWEFEVGKVAIDKDSLSKTINVPYCPESKKSGLELKDVITDCIYARNIELTAQQLEHRLVIHFGAVDHEATVYINGNFVGYHCGGYTHFEVDISEYAIVGSNRLVVVVHDDIRENVPSGKQSLGAPHGCFYTPCTGIWQSVWMEETPKQYVRSVKFYPDVENCKVTAVVDVLGCDDCDVSVFYQGQKVGQASARFAHQKQFEISLSQKHIWELGSGRLYDVQIAFGDDTVQSYFGLRSTQFRDGKFLLNGKSVFQRLVLDQGYYPDGLYTGTREEWICDIQYALRLGYNGARLHQKVFEPAYLYECDKAGYMVWGEFPNWGVDYYNLDALGVVVNQWKESVEYLFNHPSIVVWCPLNEVWESLTDEMKHRDVRFVEAIYAVTKLLDSTRPCIDVSGGHHGRFTDCFDFHCYYNYEELKKHIDNLVENNKFTARNLFPLHHEEAHQDYQTGLAVQLSEYGGIRLGECNGWGYTLQPSEQAFVEEYIKQTKAIMDCKLICGFCYTQLYDVEQEQNGLLTYQRKPKLSEEAMDAIALCNKSMAAIEFDIVSLLSESQVASIDATSLGQVAIRKIK